MKADASRALVVLSGGQDSTTCLYWTIDRYGAPNVDTVTFDYGQRHRKELDCATKCAAALQVPHKVIDISGIAPLVGKSALTDDIEVPHGHYEAENMKLTVVPNRNAIMLSLAYGYACTIEAEALACGVHSGDHAIYPDCRPEFIEQLNTALATGTDGHRNPDLKIIAPFVNIDKGDIAKIGANCGVNFADTWTCYEGGDIHCGQCGACVERQEALAELGDPTEYANPVGA